MKLLYLLLIGGNAFIAAAVDSLTGNVEHNSLPAVMEGIEEYIDNENPTVATDEDEGSQRRLQDTTREPSTQPTGIPTKAPVAPPTPSEFILYTYHGCYIDDITDRGLPFFAGDGTSTMDCASKCRGFGFSYFGRQWTEECWCGGDTYDKHGINEAGCDCESANLGIGRNCVYRSYPPVDTVPHRVAGLAGLSCAKPTSLDNGSLVDFPVCYTNEGTEEWTKSGEQIVHSSGKCLTMLLDDKAVVLGVWDCLSNGDNLYPNQVFDYTPVCANCIGDEMNGTGYDGSCSADGVCENSTIWNKYYIPDDLSIIFSSCDEIMEFDSSAESGKYVIKQENGLTAPVNCDFGEA